MTEVSDIRFRLAEITFRAEKDEDFRQRLAADPTAILNEYGIPENAVEEFSHAISRARFADDDPTSCIHTDGCQDFTCFSSNCPNTCFVSIVIDAPDA